MRTLTFVFIIASFMGCQNPPRTPETAPDEPETAGAPAETTTAEQEPLAETGSDDAPVFDPDRNSCVEDSDCELTGLAITQPHLCCHACGIVAVSKTWLVKASAACEQYRKGNDCPKFRCDLPDFDEARCVEGKCVAQESGAAE